MSGSELQVKQDVYTWVDVYVSIMVRILDGKSKALIKIDEETGT